MARQAITGTELSNEPGDQFRFGAFTLDLARGTLTQPDGEVFLRPKAYSLITHLARNLGRIVPKSELMDVVWPNVYVTEDSLTQSIREIRKALGETGPDLLRTAAKRGYMLNGGRDAALSSDSQRQPVVAVLRFRNEGGEAADDPIVDGFAEDIIRGLARFGSVTVLARASSFSFASFVDREWSATAERIGADYIVEGSVRRSGEDAQIVVNLVDASKSTQLWSERYEARDIELFAVQREIGQQIVSRLERRLDEVSLHRSAAIPTSSLAAYELVIRGAKSLRSFTEAPPGEARSLFELALQRDPEYGLAYAYLALESAIFGGLGRTPQPVLKKARELAARCISIAPDKRLATG